MRFAPILGMGLALLAGCSSPAASPKDGGASDGAAPLDARGGGITDTSSGTGGDSSSGPTNDATTGTADSSTDAMADASTPDAASTGDATIDAATSSLFSFFVT